MNIKKLKKFFFYIPFTTYFVAFAAAIFAGWRIVRSNETVAQSSFADIFTLLLKVALGFTLFIASLALLTVLVSYLYFLIKNRKGNIRFKLETDFSESEIKQRQTIKLLFGPVLRPLFGFVKLRLQYDELHFSKKFSLLQRSSSGLFSKTIEGTYHWALPQIKEYRVHKALLYFEDIFQFFSIAVTLPANSIFNTQPFRQSLNEMPLLPRKTENTSTRIDQMRRVEGEYLNYKNFETNDDVRRIVWKIYAKNKELVVRIPETMDPYASHVYLYASFFSSFDVEGNNAVEIPFLNYYKVMLWSVYQTLAKQGLEVRYIDEEGLLKSNAADEQQRVKHAVSIAKWQRITDLTSYVKTNDAAVVMISSLSNAAEVKSMVDECGTAISFIFIKLSDAFKNQALIDWVEWLFVQNDKDDIEVHKRSWALSPLRSKLKENERKLEKIVGSNTLASVKA